MLLTYADGGEREEIVELKSVLVMQKFDCTLHNVPEPHSEEYAESTLTQMSAALAHVHACNYAHCDVKSTNIFVSADGKIHTTK